MRGAAKILSKYSKSIKDEHSLIKYSNKGISVNAFFEIVELSGINRNFLAEQVFDISIKTLLRYKKENKTLSTRDSEIALKLFGLLRKGENVFGTLDHFRNWINKPAFGLGNKIPVNLLNTLTGIDLIEEELLRIEFGALA